MARADGLQFLVAQFGVGGRMAGSRRGSHLLAACSGDWSGPLCARLYEILQACPLHTTSAPPSTNLGTERAHSLLPQPFPVNPYGRAHGSVQVLNMVHLARGCHSPPFRNDPDPGRCLIGGTFSLACAVLAPKGLQYPLGTSWKDRNP
jgi:hypothetical protein